MIDRELAFPKELDKWIPPWYMHMLVGLSSFEGFHSLKIPFQHTAPTIFVFADVFLREHEWPKRSTALKTVLFCAAGYNIKFVDLSDE